MSRWLVTKRAIPGALWMGVAGSVYWNAIQPLTKPQAAVFLGLMLLVLVLGVLEALAANQVHEMLEQSNRTLRVAKDLSAISAFTLDNSVRLAEYRDRLTEICRAARAGEMDRLADEIEEAMALLDASARTAERRKASNPTAN